MTEDFYNKLGSDKLMGIASEYNIDDKDLVDSLVREGDVILDLGCGYGRVSNRLAREDVKVFGIDLSSELISRAIKDSRDLDFPPEYVVGNMISLPYEDNKFSKIFCLWNSFNHLVTEDDQVTCLDEVHRTLVTGGSAYFVLLNGEDNEMRELVDKTGSKIITREHCGEKAEQFVHDSTTIESLVEKSNFSNYSMKIVDLDSTKRMFLVLKKF